MGQNSQMQLLSINCQLSVWLPVSHHTLRFFSKKARHAGFFVDQPGIEPRFSEPKSDVIAFIPLVTVDFLFESGCKGTAFF